MGLRSSHYQKNTRDKCNTNQYPFGTFLNVHDRNILPNHGVKTNLAQYFSYGNFGWWSGHDNRSNNVHRGYNYDEKHRSPDNVRIHECDRGVYREYF